MPSMGSTKIINVLKDDTFEELLDLVQSASAQEIIFILPKRGKAFAKEQDFAALSEVAREERKKISLLCSNPEALSLARQYGFEALPDRMPSRSGTRKAEKTPPAVLAQAPGDEDEDNIRGNRDADEEDVVVPSDEAISSAEEEPEGIHTEEKGDLPAGEAEEGTLEPEDQNTLAEEEKEPSPDELEELETELGEPVAQGTAAGSGRPRVEKQDRDWQELARTWHHERRPLRAMPQIPRRFYKFFVIGGLVLVGIGVLLVTVPGRARVLVKPVERNLEAKLAISVSDQFPSVDSTFSKIPGQLFAIERTVSQEFPASGEKEVAQKARGKIAVYNEYGTTPQILIATTRFESEQGLIFRTLRTITVPGTTMKDGKTVPGTAEVEVIAEKPGQAYNIGPGRFTVPAFRERSDTARYEKFYAISSVALSGGIVGPAKVVTDADYSQAREAVLKKLQQSVQEALAAEASGLQTVASSSFVLSRLDASAQPDQAADIFTVSASGTLKTMGFRKEDLHALITEYVRKYYDVTVLPDRLSLSYLSARLDESRSVLELSLNISGPSYIRIDEGKIVADLLGKRENDIRDYLKSAQGVASARVVLSPFWVSRMPAEKERVKLELNYDQR